MFFVLVVMVWSCAGPSDDIEEPRPPVGPSNTLPVLFVETENGAKITSKTEYVMARYWLDPAGTPGVEAIGTAEEPLKMEIRGRGHSSWKGEKKPYKVRLAEKCGVLGMAENRHWALLKPTENTVAGMRLSRLAGMAWTPDFRAVEVVLNGDYIGLYFITETIRIDENRVAIHKQKDLETDPEEISGGWLVEVDNYRDECQIDIRENENWNMTLRYHSPDRLSDAQRGWLKAEFYRMNAAIYSDDKTSTEWEKYVDVENMARFFVIQEVMDNPDGFHGSFYLHKDAGEGSKWTAGPVWDCACYNREKTDYTFRMKVHYKPTPHWIGQMIRYESFCREVEAVWESLYRRGGMLELYDMIDKEMEPLEEAWRNDCERWGGNREETACFRADRIKNALRRNAEWLDGHLPSAY